FAAAFALVGALFTWMALRTERLACPKEGSCMIDGRPLFVRATMRDVHIEHRRGSKNAKYDVVVFDLEAGRHVESMQVEPGYADEAVARIRQSLVSNRPFDETLTGPRYL